MAQLVKILKKQDLSAILCTKKIREIREKRGLVYSVYCFPNYYTGSGFTGISAATDREQINEMMPVMIDEIKKMTNEKVSEEELSRAKSQMNFFVRVQCFVLV